MAYLYTVHTFQRKLYLCKKLIPYYASGFLITFYVTAVTFSARSWVFHARSLRNGPLQEFQMIWDNKSCYDHKEMNLNKLPKIIEEWGLSEDKKCRASFHIFKLHFDIEMRQGKLNWSPTFGAKMFKWLGNNANAMEAAKSQKIIFIKSKMTGEESIFNPLRQLRPQPVHTGTPDLQYVAGLARKAAASCDFCDYQNKTAYDDFGRIVSTHSVTGANAFKLDEYHGLIILREHHPLRWDLKAIADVFNVIQKWIMEAVKSDQDSVFYPLVTWDLLPRSGSSQLHPHLHVLLHKHGYHGHQEVWSEAALKYNSQHPNRNFYTDYVGIHFNLKLAIQHGTAVALAHLTPKKENEVMIVSQTVNTDFTDLLYAALRTYIDKMGLYSFSLVISLPPVAGGNKLQPVVARMFTRGSVQSLQADITSMEIYAASCIDTDLFKFSQILRSSISKTIDLKRGFMAS